MSPVFAAKCSVIASTDVSPVDTCASQHVTYRNTKEDSVLHADGSEPLRYKLSNDLWQHSATDEASTVE
jgi:hypothetical protein